jgi:hypothetical protein
MPSLIGARTCKASGAGCGFMKRFWRPTGLHGAQPLAVSFV